jgi:signal transduction histidine kinase
MAIDTQTTRIDAVGDEAIVTESAAGESDVRLEAALPNGAASLASILRNEELLARPSRPSDHERENLALVALVGALADHPDTILQTLANKVCDVLRADSAGLSLLTKDGERFYWAAIAGAWKPHIGGGTPRNFGPCGDVLDCNRPMLFSHWERRYPYLGTALPLADEGLLVPFFVNGKAVGTIWAIAHNEHRKFDREDLRLLESMGRFASAAYQTVESIEDLKLQMAAREKAEVELHKLTDHLEEQVLLRTAQLTQASETLREAQTELAHANRVATMGQMAASIAHEIKQPITVAVGSAEAAFNWLGNQPPKLDEVGQALSRIVEAGTQATEFIERVRNFFKKAPARKDPFEINQAIHEVIALTRSELANNKVSVQMEFADGLPVVQGDRVQLQQVTLNLIINAIEAMTGLSDGSRQLLIGTERDASGEVLVTVQDSGPGLNPDSLDNLFDAFYTTKPDGMGMGLSISRSIVEAHGGRLWAVSHDGPGAIFQFTLPTNAEA